MGLLRSVPVIKYIYFQNAHLFSQQQVFLLTLDITDVITNSRCGTKSNATHYMSNTVMFVFLAHPC